MDADLRLFKNLLKKRNIKIQVISNPKTQSLIIFAPDICISSSTTTTKQDDDVWDQLFQEFIN